MNGLFVGYDKQGGPHKVKYGKVGLPDNIIAAENIIVTIDFVPFVPKGIEVDWLMWGASGSYQQQPPQNQQQPPQNQWPFAMFQPQQQLSQPLLQPHSDQGSAAANSHGRASSGSEGGRGSGGGNAYGGGIFAGGVGNTSLLEMLTDPTFGSSVNEGI